MILNLVWIASNKALIFVRLLNLEFSFGVWNMSPTQCYRIQGHQQAIRQHGKLFKNGGSRQKAKKQSREAKHQENNIRITGRLDYKEYKKIWQAGRKSIHQRGWLTARNQIWRTNQVRLISQAFSHKGVKTNRLVGSLTLLQIKNKHGKQEMI